MRRLAGLICLVGALLGSLPAGAADESAAQVVEGPADIMGLSGHSRSFPLLDGRGVRILNLPGPRRFAAVWKPDGFASGRILVLLPGTGGSPYDALKDEVGMAGAYDVMLVGLQWHDPKPDTYDDPKDVYRNIDTVLRYLHATDGVPLTQVALSGFSRGGAISYEVAYRDLQSNKYFDLIVGNSGAIRPDGIIAPKKDTGPGAFYVAFLGRHLGETPFAGARFFLYAGGKDEQWGSEMAENMAFTRDALIQSGAEITDCIIDPEGKHMGLRENEAYHKRVYERFLTLTGGDPTPIRPIEPIPAMPPQPEGAAKHSKQRHSPPVSRHRSGY